MNQLPLSLNVRDAYQLEQLIVEVDGKIQKQAMLLLSLRLNRQDTVEVESTLAELRQYGARLRAQRANVDLALGLRARAAE